MADWIREPDLADHELVSLCDGPTIDIGCGPGRLAATLASRGHIVLGIDIVHEAVHQTRERGVAALRRDVWDTLPGEGRWATALLADGNVGIGGDPVALLRRAREVLDPRGRVVVEVAPPGVPHAVRWATIECADARSKPFRWAVLGVDDVARVAAEAGLVAGEPRRLSDPDRWCVVLEEPS
ncbi:MAG: methyltransferase domain-containing protein [Actinobacteria bacterium]|nr:methyltransferase domain-containing protein [Actinomycetota bacterium]